MRSLYEVGDLLKRLSDVPSRITLAVTKLSDEQKYSIPAEGRWSAVEIMAHIRAADDIVAYRLYAVLVRDNPTLVAYDERRWAEIAGYAGDDFEALLKTYTLRRAELVRTLRQAAIPAWERTGTHEEKGQISLFEIATSLVEHEEEHCLQLEAL